MNAKEDTSPVVEMKTNKGTIKIELNREKAPGTVKNFLQYVEDKHYDGVVFHRVIDGFMIQGGGFSVDDGKIVEKATRSGIQNEAKNGLKNDRGTIAMARTNDPHSASAQFFINVGNNSNLDYPSFDGWGYAVFGKVTEGLDVVDKIKGVKTGTRELSMLHNGRVITQPAGDVPVEDVVIESVRLVGASEEAEEKEEEKAEEKKED
ncbi:MAG: peptidylprolyl isomerase [Verrucomicrobiota bacterium]